MYHSFIYRDRFLQYTEIHTIVVTRYIEADNILPFGGSRSTNRLEDGIRRRGGEYAKYLFPLTLAARDRALGRKDPLARGNRITRLVKILFGRKFLVTRGATRFDVGASSSSMQNNRFLIAE